MTTTTPKGARTEPSWGFGMAPIKPAMTERRRRWVQTVLNFVEADHEDVPAPRVETLEAVSEVKGLFNRIVRMDQWDWFTVWMQLGKPSPRKQCAPMVQALTALRAALKDDDAQGVANAVLAFRKVGGDRALQRFLTHEPVRHQFGLGYVYVLSRRSDPRQLVVGYTASDIVQHVAGINAGGDHKDLYGVRGLWVVRDLHSMQRETADALATYRLFPDRNLYELDFRQAVHIITSVVNNREIAPKLVGPSDIARLDAPEPTRAEHPEAAAAEERRRIVQRTEPNWSKFGFTVAENHQWVKAGVPEDRAHWAAMCRDSMRRSNPQIHLTSGRLQRPINASGDTVLDALTHGQNAVRIQARIAAGADLDGAPGIPDELLAVAAENFTAASARAATAGTALRKAVSRADPAHLPQIARLVADLDEAMRPLWAARLRLAREIDAYQRNGTAGELLSAFARAHGVYVAGALLGRLINGVVGTIDELEHAARATALIGRAARSGNFLYLAPDAVAEASGYRNAAEEFRSLTASPYPVDPRGFALIAATESADNNNLPARFLAWELDGERINATLVNRGKLAGALMAKPSAIGLVESWHPRDGLDGVDGAVRHTRLLNDLAREAHQRAREAGGEKVGPLRPRTPEDRSTVLVYQAARSEGGSANVRLAPDHRWKVRGHWRRQWHPSENAHKILWIDEHVSGPADRPLITVDRVRVITT